MAHGKLAAVCGVCAGGLGAWLGYRLGDNPVTAGLGFVIGGLSPAYAPVLADRIQSRSARRVENARAAGLVEQLGEVHQPSRLLSPERGLVNFTGREAEEAELLAWCEDDTASKVWLMRGAGGIGKTRLAYRLTERLTELGWHCEFVGANGEATILSEIRKTRVGRVLLVVDSAETRIGLPTLLREAATDTGILRVLLLARDAGEWWQQIQIAEPAIRDMVARAGSRGRELGCVLDEDLSDENVVRLAMSCFARELRVELPESVEVVLSNGRARVLELHAAALVAVLKHSQEPQHGVQAVLEDVLVELLAREQFYWAKSAEAYGLTQGPDGLTSNKLRQVIAAAALLGARDELDAMKLLQRVPGVPATVKLEPGYATSTHQITRSRSGWGR